MLTDLVDAMAENKYPISEYLNSKELLGILADMIRIPSHMGYSRRECDMVDYIASICRKEGIEYRLQPADGERCNIIAVIRGNGSGKSLMFNGHTDTVPVAGMDAPYNAVIRDGYMYGRGTTDMKGGLAAMLYSLILIKRMGIELDGDLVFAGVIDEEAAKSTGSRVVAEQGSITDYAIVGEPTALHPVTAQKGIDYFQTSFTGKATHSSQPWNGANAIYAAADYIKALRGGLARKYEAMEHEKLGCATINVGLISGSAEINKDFLLGNSETFAGVVPDRADVYADVRWLPCQSVPEIQLQLEQLLPDVLAANPGVSASVTYIPLPRPAMEISDDELLAQAVLKNVRAVSPETAVPQGFFGFTDAGILYGIGKIKSMVFGPGDISVAHSTDERVCVEEVVKAAEIYTQTALDICISK